jgi:dihydrofolate synthase/folylpolyglutamate synthase
MLLYQKRPLISIRDFDFSPSRVTIRAVFTYEDALAYLEHFTNAEPQPTSPLSMDQTLHLERVTRLLDGLGNPHQRYPVVHVAGTKGKGSVSAICASVLQAAGYRVGLYTSPHLQDFRERIQVQGELIPREAVVALVERMRPLIEAIPHLRTFELVTAMACAFFAEQGVEAAVLEVGLGGRLDATNVVTPVVSAIASLSFDHTSLLGNTLAEIAAEKGGIIKPGVPVVVAPQPPEALAVLKRLAAERAAPLTLVGVDWLFRSVWHSLDEQMLEVRPAGGPAQQLGLALLGAHQAENGAVAYAALSILRERGWTIRPEALAEGFRQVRWPGRFEILGRRPMVVADGAHNQDSARRLMAAMRDYFPGRPMILIFGASRNKEVTGMFADLLGDGAEAVSRVILTEASSPRAWEAHELLALAQAASPGRAMQVVLPAAQALEKALELSAPDDVILACGSLFVVADVRAAWKLRA